MARRPAPLSLHLNHRMMGNLPLQGENLQALLKRAAGLTLQEKYLLFVGEVNCFFCGYLSPKEEIVNQRLIAMFKEQGVSWFHGGFGKLTKGQTLMPPAATGAAMLASLHDTGRAKFVWVTPHRHIAEAYAAERNEGCVYRVEPSENLMVDPNSLRVFLLLQLDPEVTLDIQTLAFSIGEFRCTSAEVLEVCGPMSQTHQANAGCKR